MLQYLDDIDETDPNFAVLPPPNHPIDPEHCGEISHFSIHLCIRQLNRSNRNLGHDIEHQFWWTSKRRLKNKDHESTVTYWTGRKDMAHAQQKILH